MTRFGAQLYTVREFTQTAQDFLNTLKKCKEIGFKVVQISGIGKDIPIEAVKDALDETGLICRATHITFDEMKSDLPAVIRKHKLWECPYPGVGSMPGEYRTSGADGFKKFAKDASEIAKKFKDEGLTFIYHNHNFEFMRFDGVTGMDILFNESDPALQFELDLYWVQAGGANPVDWVNKVKGRMDVVHFKDMQIIQEEGQPRVTQAFAEIGYGNLNWPVNIDACYKTDVKWAFIEQDKCFRDPFESLKMSFDYLKSQGMSE